MEGVSAENVLIDGIISSRTIDLLESHSREIYDRWAPKRKYDAEVLYKFSDFRRLVNLLYITRLSERMGSPQDWNRFSPFLWGRIRSASLKRPWPTKPS